MAQKYNPTTGQWEEEDEENSLTGGAIAAFGVGSSPAVDGSAMTGPPPLLELPGFFNGPNGLGAGYGWGDDNYLKSQGYTKQYSSPWDTSYNYLDSSGKSLGKGYDSYQDAIRKLAFTSGMSEVQPIQSTYDAENGSWSTASPGGYTHSYYGAENQRTFTTQQELYNALLKEAGNPLGYESREKYGRKLTEGQLQNMYAQYASGDLKGAVPDWEYHRAAYPGAGGTQKLVGDAALIGSTALFGPQGIAGYKTNLNPTHLNLADNEGRVRSSSSGSTRYLPGVTDIVRLLDDNYGFINSNDISKYGYKSSSANNYDKADSSFESFLKTAAPIALAAFALPQLGTLFSGATAGAEALGGAELLGELGGYGFTSAEVAGALPELLGGGSLVEAGLHGIGGLGLEGASGLISDLGSLFSPSNINGLELSNFGDFINGLDPSAFTGSNFTPSLGDVTTSTLADTGASSLSSFAPEIMGPQEPFYFDDWGKGTNALGEMTNGKGFRALQDIGANTLRDLGVARDTAANLSQGAGKMYNFMTEPMGGKRPGIFQAPSPLNTLFRGVGALDSMKQNREAMDYLEKMRASLNGNASNPNRARGDFANKEWMNTWSNPRQGFDQWMSGLGREFQQKANAAAAAGGKRGSYMNSGKGLTDLYSKWMAGQNDRARAIQGGFEGNIDNTNARAAYDSAMIPMIKNQNAPLFQMLGNTGMQYGLSELFDLLG